MARCCSSCWYDRCCWFFGLATAILGGISVFFGIGALMYWNNPNLIGEFGTPIWVGVFLICCGGLIMANNKCRRWEDINKEYLEELELQLVSEEDKPPKKVDSLSRLFRSRSKLSIRSDGKSKVSKSSNPEREIFDRLDVLRKEELVEEDGSMSVENKDTGRQRPSPASSRRGKVRKHRDYELLNEMEDQQINPSQPWHSEINCISDDKLNEGQNGKRSTRIKAIPDHAYHERIDMENEQLEKVCHSQHDFTPAKVPMESTPRSKRHRRHHKIEDHEAVGMVTAEEDCRLQQSRQESRKSRSKRKHTVNVANSNDEEHFIGEHTTSQRADMRPMFGRSFSGGYRDTGSATNFYSENTSQQMLHHTEYNSTMSLQPDIGRRSRGDRFVSSPRARRRMQGDNLMVPTMQLDSRSLPATPERRRKVFRHQYDIVPYSVSLPGTPESRRRQIDNPLEHYDCLDPTTMDFYQKPGRVGEVRRKSPSQRSVNSMAEYQKRSLDKFMIPAFTENQDGTVSPDDFVTASLDRRQHRSRHRSQPLATTKSSSSRDRMDSRRSVPDIIISQDAMVHQAFLQRSFQTLDESQQFVSPNSYRQMAVRPKESGRTFNRSVSYTNPPTAKLETTASPRDRASPAQNRRSTAPALAGLERIQTYRNSYTADGNSSEELETDIYEHMVRERMRKFRGNTTEPKVIFPTRKRRYTSPAVSPATRRRYMDEIQQSPFFNFQTAGTDLAYADKEVDYSPTSEPRKYSLPPYLNADRRQRRASGKQRKPSIPYLESYSSESEVEEIISLAGSRSALNSRGSRSSRTVSPVDSLEGILDRTGGNFSLQTVTDFADSRSESKMASRSKRAKHHGRSENGGSSTSDPRKKRVRSPKLVSDIYESSGQENSATESETFPPTAWQTGKINNDVVKCVYSEEDEIRLLYSSNNEDAPYVKNNDGKVGNSRAHVLLNDDKEGVMVVVVKKRDK